MRLRIAGIVLMLAVAASAQHTTSPAAAPVPEQIAKAKTVFISNAGADGADGYTGGDERPYNQFYAEMKNWGRYELMPGPAGSDLVFELRFGCTVFWDGVVSECDPQLRVRILDPSTRLALWAFTGHIKNGNNEAKRDKNFDNAMAGLVGKTKALADRH